MTEGTTTAVEYDKVYDAEVLSKEEALKLISEYGKAQRKKYFDIQIKQLERKMEILYHIAAVNLGELDIETAKDIEAAFSYMYKEYPCLQGSLTNLTLGNMGGKTQGVMAITQNRDFILNEEYGKLPYVVKYEIVLNAGSFRNRERLLKNCQEFAESSYWPQNADISSIVVHELGHQLLNVIIWKEYGLRNPWYINEDNEYAYSCFLADGLSMNQAVAKAVIERAYDVWKTEYGRTGEETDFRQSISGYAEGEQADGGISYTETFAEAIADTYLNGEQAADASKAIVKVAKERYLYRLEQGEED